MELLTELNFNAGYESLLAKILTTYFTGVFTLCRVLHRADGRFTNITANIGTDLPFVVVVEQKSFWFEFPLKPAIEHGCTVFVVDENAIFKFLDKYIPSHDESMFRRPEKYVIMIMTIRATQIEHSIHLKRILFHPALQEIPNLLLVVPNGNAVKLMTHRYVGNLPGSMDLLHLDTYFPQNNTYLLERNLFPNKLANLMGKTFKLASFFLLPWVMPRRTDDGIVRYLEQSHTIDGLDGYILVQFCLWYNCTWSLSIDQEKQYGHVFDNNHSGNGMIGALLYREADFAIGAVGGWYQLFQYFSFSAPIQWIGITCLAPKSTLISSWKIIFMMFTKPVWAMVIASFIIISIFDRILPRHYNTVSSQRKSLSWSFLNVLASFLLLPSYLRRDRTSEVIVSLVLITGTFIIGYVYIGKIHSILAVPIFQPPIDTVIDLAESGLPWNAPHEAWTFMLKGSENPYIQQVLRTFNVAPIPALHRIADEGKQSFVMATLHNGHSMVGTWLTANNIENYRLMTEFLYYEYDTGYATKTWPLLDNFDYLAMWIRDACLFRYVELQEVYHYMDYRVQISIEHSRDKQKTVLKPFGVSEISGGLLILGFGYAIASVLFICEVTAKFFK
ncbi:uncharacterized protein LOC131428753 [Malaya genurostris]|uniref:uncharacterized protein LOC131428753 n=1 Tax=Malaya genurostris TaxID=325434 RepID=UPI0026F3F80B|nr:uncharacterized protein LOC131428753 [Malaya genurostris]